MEFRDWINWSTLVSVIDVLVVWLLLYRVILLVKGTRAQSMLVGLGMLILVYFISSSLGLVGLSWILGHFLGSAVILLIVVLFQDEIRRALIKVGVYPVFGGAAAHAMERTITEISKAAAELASRRLGALLVVKRDVGLDDYTESAVQVDALVSHQILVSIFLPTSPIHDGAVVTDGERIVSAGTVLPLSFAPELGGKLGTRHRAAIGLSERSDALIVVVSEETGIISLVREGRMTRDLNERTLYNALHRLTVFRQRRITQLRSMAARATGAPGEKDGAGA